MSSKTVANVKMVNTGFKISVFGAIASQRNPLSKGLASVQCETLPTTFVGRGPYGKSRVMCPILWLPMKTQGEIESAISEGMSRFEQEYMGRGPKDISVHLIDDLIVIRLKGVLTAAEQHLVKTLPPEKGRDLLKEVRTHLIEIARPSMEAMIHDITGVKVQSLHHDISTTTGEEIVLFSLSESPLFRETKKR
jgi:uncharacterized protein YbcI